MLFSQERPNFAQVDSLYREDQFYIGLTYNTLLNMPTGITQNKFTPSFTFGVLRDFPINKKRTFAIAPGLGYQIQNYNQNILISELNGIVQYQEIQASSYEKNKLTLNYIDLPIELRWRNSTPQSHVFWRIYTGFKCSYLVYDRSKYIDSQGEIRVENNKDLNKLLYAVYLSIGRNTWNFHLQYGLNPIFKSAQLNATSIQMNPLHIGLMFYIL